MIQVLWFILVTTMDETMSMERIVNNINNENAKL